ncbi:MAG: BspA family leucine-rich repeat surface protein [Bacteroides sp.]
MRRMFKVMMTTVLVALLYFGSVASGFAQGGEERPFITKWQGKAGEVLKLPIVGTDYKLVIKNEKGAVVKTEEKVTVTGKDDSYYHVFTPEADGVYTVEAGPAGVKYMRMKAKWKEEEKKNIPITSNEQLLEVVQFGTVAWKSMTDMFKNCRRMTFAVSIDTPDLTKVTDMGGMFSYCSSFNQPLNHWDVSQVTKMSGMFSGCSSFNQPLEKWNVSQVTKMRVMFFGCSSFNQPLAGWNVSQVTDMYGMFGMCTAFNQPLNDWNVSNVISMNTMFYDCTVFNQPLNNWDVSNVTNMNGMFVDCIAFNQPLNNWNVSNVTNMGAMFMGCTAFNQPLEKWNVYGVKSMGKMFFNCTSFNQPLEKWDVRTVARMSDMFYLCKSFNQPLGAWKLQIAIGGLSTTAMSAINYSLSLIGWAKQTDGASNIKFGEEVKGLVYNDAGKAAREKLIARGWTFEGDVYKPSEKVAISLAKEGEGTLTIEGYNDEALQAVTVGTELTVTATPKEGYSLTSLTAGTQDIFATKKFTVMGAVTVKAVFKKKENNGGGGNNGGNNGGGNNGGNNGGGNNGGGAWQPQKPGTSVEDAVLASLSVTPNPFSSQLRLENPEGVAAHYELVNASGLVLRSGAFSATELFIDTEALPAGLYFVRIEAQNGAKKIVRVVKH